MQVSGVDTDMTYPQLLKHALQREKPQKEENRLYRPLLCVPNRFAVIQRVDVGGGKVCTQAAKMQLILWWEEDCYNLGRRPLALGYSANCLKLLLTLGWSAKCD